MRYYYKKCPEKNLLAATAAALLKPRRLQFNAHCSLCCSCCCLQPPQLSRITACCLVAYTPPSILLLLLLLLHKPIHPSIHPSSTEVEICPMSTNPTAAIALQSVRLFLNTLSLRLTKPLQKFFLHSFNPNIFIASGLLVFFLLKIKKKFFFSSSSLVSPFHSSTNNTQLFFSIAIGTTAKKCLIIISC